mmetsp:Transcript_84156/g.265660  ORF Transcript_84156/g.265660 Transcript_84156/m.265660 type:complete len:292 (+) Transcript_84156:427-1302(+)
MAEENAFRGALCFYAARPQPFLDLRHCLLTDFPRVASGVNNADLGGAASVIAVVLRRPNTRNVVRHQKLRGHPRTEKRLRPVLDGLPVPCIPAVHLLHSFAYPRLSDEHVVYALERFGKEGSYALVALAHPVDRLRELARVARVREPELAEGLDVHAVEGDELGYLSPALHPLDVLHTPGKAHGELLVHKFSHLLQRRGSAQDLQQLQRLQRASCSPRKDVELRLDKLLKAGGRDLHLCPPPGSAPRGSGGAAGGAGGRAPHRTAEAAQHHGPLSSHRTLLSGFGLIPCPA